jgi:diguanylate cyclase (GGDEF)-like protein/PAS domain S-box-containing protein
MEKDIIKILVVDDEEIIRNILALYLKDMGYEPVTAMNGDEAIRIFDDNTPDLVLLDLNMPGKSGFDVLQEIRSRNGDVPVIIISGVGLIEEAMKAIEMGAWDFITKPIKDFSVLNHHIKRAIERLRLISSNRMYQNYLEDEVDKRIRQLKHEMEIRNEAEKKYRSIFENSNDAILIMKDNLVIDCNRRTGDLYGAEPEKMIGVNPLLAVPENISDGIPSADMVKGHLEKAINGEPQFFELAQRRPDGSTFWVEVNLNRVSLKDDVFMMAVVRDITKRKKSEEMLTLLSMTMERSLSSVLIADSGGIIEYVNPKYLEISGYTRYEITGRMLDSLGSGLSSREQYSEMWGIVLSGKPWQGEMHNRKKNGEFYWAFTRISPIKNDAGQIRHLVVIEEDITVRKEYEDKLIQQANYDSLTNLPNRILLMDRLNQEMARAQRQRRYLVLMLIDLDNFKKVNEFMGHASGDDVLKEVALRLQKCVRNSDTIARFSGDKFFVLLQDLVRPGEAESIAEKILSQIKEPFIVEDNEFSLTASIGLTVYPPDGDSPNTLMKNADSAMYRSKEAGKNRYSFFSFELNERAMYRLQIENNLRYALEKQELFLVFQPQISLSTQKIVGAECLIRWKSAELGFVPPDAFISIAEETGMIISIGAFVLSEACREATSWIDILGEPIRLSVNVSSKQFRGIDFHTMVKQVLDSTGYSAENLEIEITESILVTDVEHTVQILNRLVDDGISISVDDFGTGYSSLSYLKRFPIATLKIDKSFINHITTDAGDQALSKSIIAMGHSLEWR